MVDLQLFENFLREKRLTQEKHLSYYLHWVSRFLTFCSDHHASPADDSQTEPFLRQLAKTKEEWQVKQAREALQLFLFYQSRNAAGDALPPSAPDQA